MSAGRVNLIVNNNLVSVPRQAVTLAVLTMGPDWVLTIEWGGTAWSLLHKNVSKEEGADRHVVKTYANLRSAMERDTRGVCITIGKGERLTELSDLIAEFEESETRFFTFPLAKKMEFNQKRNDPAPPASEAPGPSPSPIPTTVDPE